MLMLSCEACGIEWAQSYSRTCLDCGEQGSPHSIVRACTTSTGLAIEGHAYAKAHPGWVR